MADWTKRNLRDHFNRAKANGWLPTFEAQAKRTNFPVEILLAIASRESNMRNIRGDFRGGIYHGYGLLQLDIGSHKEWIEGGWWKDPHAVIEKGAHALYVKRREVANLAKAAGETLSDQDLLSTAIAAYNHGSKGSYNDLIKYGNPDRNTTGKDYSADVLKRAAYFREFLAAEPSRVATKPTAIPPDLPTESPELVTKPADAGNGVSGSSPVADSPTAEQAAAGKPTIAERFKTSTTFFQSLGLQAGAVLTGIIGFLANGGWKVLAGAAVVAVAVYWIYTHKEIQIAKLAAQKEQGAK